MTKEWEKWRPTIVALYKGEGKTLAQTMKVMDEKHDFKASVRAYRSRLKRWDVCKYKIPRRKSAPSGSTSLPPAALPAAMAQSNSYPGTSAADPTRTRPRPRPSTGSRYEWSPFSYGNTHSPASAVSPQSHFDQAGQYHGQPAQQQQQHSHHNCVHSPLEQQQVNSFHTHGQAHNRPTALPLHFPPIQHQQPSHNVQLDANEAFFTLYNLLSPHSPPSSPTEAEERVVLVKIHIQQLARLGRLNDRSFGVNGMLTRLTAFELCVQNFASEGFLSHYLHLFCSLCASFVQLGADTGRFVPIDFEATVGQAVEQENLEILHQSLQRHQQQQQPHGSADIPHWISIWISACMQSLRGHDIATNYPLFILRNFMAEDLTSLLPRYQPDTPDSWRS